MSKQLLNYFSTPFEYADDEAVISPDTINILNMFFMFSHCESFMFYCLTYIHYTIDKFQKQNFIIIYKPRLICRKINISRYNNKTN